MRPVLDGVVGLAPPAGEVLEGVAGLEAAEAGEPLQPGPGAARGVGGPADGHRLVSLSWVLEAGRRQPSGGDLCALGGWRLPARGLILARFRPAAYPNSYRTQKPRWR